MAHDHLIPRHQLALPSQPILGQKLCRDPVTNKTAQATVTCVYRAPIAGFWRNVTALWGKNLMNYTLSLSVDSTTDNAAAYTCKIDLKPWHFWAKKGYKAFDVDGSQVEIYWDLRSAKFSGSSPEPCSDYYVALVSEHQVVLLLGDYTKKVYKRAKASPASVEATLFYRRENVFGRRSFATRARFDNKSKRECDILVESSVTGPTDPEMWISIDGTMLVHIKNLQWKFRGNHTLVIDKQHVQVFWDVHAWLFYAPGTSYGLFIFKSVENDTESRGEDGNSLCDESNECIDKESQFCLFLYAWKIE